MNALRPLTPRSGFTLLELLVVIGLIAVLATLVLREFAGGGRAVALQSAQATLANVITLARTQAMGSGREARVLVNLEVAGPSAPDRYLRQLVIQVQINGSEWKTIGTARLPEGVALLPRDITSPGNLLAPGGMWTRPSDGAALRSSAFRSVADNYPDAEITVAADSAASERWAVLKFAATGTTQNGGDLVLASCRKLAPASDAAENAPLQFESPENVRGLTLSSYGLPAYVNDRTGF